MDWLLCVTVFRMMRTNTLISDILFGRVDDAAGDLAAVRNEELSDHGRRAG